VVVNERMFSQVLSRKRSLVEMRPTTGGWTYVVVGA
jgi:hypothetical protein